MPESSAAREIEFVRQLVESVRAGEAEDPVVLAEAQERGFGALMALEAELQRAQRESRGALMTAPVADAECQGLTAAIDELAKALTELRDLAAPTGGPSRVGYGFVLPGPRVTRAPRPTQA